MATTNSAKEKKLVIVIGNGMSMGMIESANLSNSIKLRMDEILPATSVDYLPPASTNLPPRPFWDEAREKVPKFVEAYEDWRSKKGHAASIYEFFSSLALSPSGISIAKIEHEISVMYNITGDISLDCRFYLWNLFKTYDTIWHGKNGASNLSNWQWAYTLDKLYEKYQITIVSFNYDIFFETYIRHRFGSDILKYYPRYCMQMLRHRPKNDVILLKPHGSINYDPLVGIDLRNSSFTINNVLMGAEAVFPASEKQPTCPHIVPPGHSVQHLIDYETDVAEAIPIAIAECDGLILCGLSAIPPDEDEVRSYLCHLRKNTPALHVDRRWDNPAGEILREFAKKGYRQWQVDDIKKIPLYLKKHIR